MIDLVEMEGLTFVLIEVAAVVVTLEVQVRDLRRIFESCCWEWLKFVVGSCFFFVEDKLSDYVDEEPSFHAVDMGETLSRLFCTWSVKVMNTRICEAVSDRRCIEYQGFHASRTGQEVAARRCYCGQRCCRRRVNICRFGYDVR